MNIAYPNGSTLVDYPLLEHEVVSSLAQRLVIDKGAIKVDSAHHNLDQAHLVLDGVLTQGQDYFKITKQGSKLLHADHTGKLFCNAGVTSPNIQDIETELTNSTHLNTHGTLVKRDNNNSTTFQHLTTNILNASQDVAMYGDCALTYTPQTSQGVNIPGYTYRFGRNTEELGDFSGVGNGLEFKEPGATGNTILIQTNVGTPTIEFRANKTAGVEWLLVRNSADLEALSLDSTGVHVRCDEKAAVYLTPGTPLTVSTLTDGLQSHWFELSVPWTAANPEAEIEIEQDVAIAGFRTIENLEVYLDDEIQANEIQSRVYIKRWGVYRFSKQKLWVVLGLQLRNNETSLVSGAFIRLTFNNKKVLT